MLERGSCLLLVLRCYGFAKSSFGWSLQPMVRVRDPRPASGLSASSKLKREDENEGRERFSNWYPVLNRRISARPRRLNQSNSSCGAEALPPTTSWSCSRHLIFNLSRERYTYITFIRAVIIHYDAKV